jgi:hypothetical protein
MKSLRPIIWINDARYINRPRTTCNKQTTEQHKQFFHYIPHNVTTVYFIIFCPACQMETKKIRCEHRIQQQPNKKENFLTLTTNANH